MGTENGGNMFPGVARPFGMAKLGTKQHNTTPMAMKLMNKVPTSTLEVMRIPVICRLEMSLDSP